MNNLIGISGKAGHGKDTVARYIQMFASEVYEMRAFADKVKEIASLISGLPLTFFYNSDTKMGYMPEEWFNTKIVPGPKVIKNPMLVRDFLQKIGTDAMRNGIGENVWINALFSNYKVIGDTLLEGEVRKVREEDLIYPNWIITDVRFPNEVQAIKDRGGILIRVDRGDYISNKKHANHYSEIALDNYKDWDYTVLNMSNIKDLRSIIKNLVYGFK